MDFGVILTRIVSWFSRLLLFCLFWFCFLNKLLGPSELWFSCLQTGMRLHIWGLLEELRSYMSGACHCACHIGNWFVLSFTFLFLPLFSLSFVAPTLLLSVPYSYNLSVGPSSPLLKQREMRSSFQTEPWWGSNKYYFLNYKVLPK